MDPVKILLVCSLLLGEDVCFGRWVEEDGDAWVKIRTRLLYPTNFASVRVNIHNERELRISYEKILYMETYLPSGYTPEYDMLLRQITDGRRILQAAFQGGVLKECDLTKDSNQILDFVSSFMKYDNSSDNFGDIFSAAVSVNYTGRNTTLAHFAFDHVQELGQLRHLTEMRTLRKECQEFIMVATKTAEEEAKSGNFTSVYAQIIENTDPERFIDLYNIPNAPTRDTGTRDTESRGMETAQEHNLSKRSTAPLKQPRSKRSSLDFNSVLIFPGTKWCGKGDLAQCYDDLGDDLELDMCCRDHDCCPFVIPPFATGFNLFNYRFHSLLHCDCDQR